MSNTILIDWLAMCLVALAINKALQPFEKFIKKDLMLFFHVRSYCVKSKYLRHHLVSNDRDSTIATFWSHGIAQKDGTKITCISVQV
jgi:hypothetical protein